MYSGWHREVDRERLVDPYYLKMMRLNSIGHGVDTYDGDLIGDVARTGQTASVQDVLDLLAYPEWRVRVMGAWYSVMYDDDQVTAAVLAALGTSLGSLDSPPLACAAVSLAGADALPALTDYVHRDLRFEWGAAGVVAAFADRVRPGYCAEHGLPEPTTRAFAACDALNEVAARLRAARIT